MLDAIELGGMPYVRFAITTWDTDSQSASLGCYATDQDLKHENMYHVDNHFSDNKLLNCSTQQYLHFVVVLPRQFVDISWVGVLTKNSAME